MGDALAIGAFLLGVVVVVWSTERLLSGLVGLATLLRAAPFVIAGVFSGLEAENIAVGVIAARDRHVQIALGTVLGGGSFVVCVALGLGALLFPLRVRVPRGVLVMFAAAPVLTGVALLGGATSRLAGGALLVAFAAAIWYLVRASRGYAFLDDEQIREQAGQRPGWWRPVTVTVLGIAVLALGAELVNYGADGIIRRFAFPATVMGMVVTPAAVEAEEVVRQAVPSRHGRHDVAAGNVIGTLLYFVLFNMGLIAAVAPVPVPTRVIAVDWPFLVGAVWLATIFLWRGRVARWQGLVLLAAYAGYVALVASGLG
ncbi:MAG: sodium:calcium antiporter [Micromonosporaceae bacterium]|nr:sodium:calcium antiporter [Micromonosporaceae bacterium]